MGTHSQDAFVIHPVMGLPVCEPSPRLGTRQNNCNVLTMVTGKWADDKKYDFRLHTRGLCAVIDIQPCECVLIQEKAEMWSFTHMFYMLNVYSLQGIVN